MVPWRGCLLFKPYIPGKAHKYDVKGYDVAPTNRYTWNFMACTGQEDPMKGLDHAEAMIMSLFDGLFGCYRTVVAENYFTSISFAKSVLEKKSRWIIE